MSKVIQAMTSRWQWRWEDMCGPNGFEFYSTEYHDLGLCFQQLCLQIPFLFIFAVTSAYYCGSQVGHVIRSRSAIYAITLRSIATFFLIWLPIVQLLVNLTYATDKKIKSIDVFLSATQCFAWLIHFGFLMALRHRLGPCPRGPIFVRVIWTILAVLSVISFRSHLIIYNHEASPSLLLSLICTSLGFCLQLLYAVTLLTGAADSQLVFLSKYEQIGERSPLLNGASGHRMYDRFMEENDPDYLGVAMEDTPCLSRFLFYWVHPLMQKGVEGTLSNADALYDLPLDLTCHTLSLKLDKALIGNVDEFRNQELINPGAGSYQAPSSSEVAIIQPKCRYTKKYNVSLLRALHTCFAGQFYGIGVLKLIADLAGFAGPLLLNELVTFIETKSEDIKWGYIYAAGLCGTTLISAFCGTHFNFQMGVVCLKIRGAIVTAIYRKTITASSTMLSSKFNAGEIVNFMSTDTDRIVNSCPSFHALWSIPFQLFVSLYLLYRIVGISFLAGLIFSIILIPLNKLIANKIGTLSTEMMKKKDARVQLMTEVLRGIRTVKFHVWEKHFIKSISETRGIELGYLKGRKFLDAFCVYLWATTPVMISILTFSTYVLLGNQLTASTVFTGLALFNMLIGPLNAFPWVLNGLTEAWVSIKRIQALLDIPDLDPDLYYNQILLNNSPEAHVIIKNGKFTWGTLPYVPETENRRKKRLPSGNIQENDTSSVSSKDGEEDPNTFAFQLANINLIVKKGEFVGIMGTVGCGKSSLLSSILAECDKLGGDVALSDIENGFAYVSQTPWLQHGTIRENILFGKVYDETKYKKVLRACALEDDIYLLPLADFTGIGDSGNTLSGGQKARIALARAVYQEKSIYVMDDILSAVDVNVGKHIFQHCILGLLKNKTRILCTHHLQYLLHADQLCAMENGKIIKQGVPSEILSDIEEILLSDIHNEDNSLYDLQMTSVDVAQTSDAVLQSESSETGSVDSKIYLTYFKSIGFALAFSILISLILMQLSRNVTDLWLSVWISKYDQSNVWFYLKIYISLACANSIATLFRAFLFAYGGIRAAKRIHKRLLKSVIWGKLRFFDVSPVGRILNRFSSDTYTVDDSLPFILNILLAQLVGVIGSVAVTIYGLPWLCLVLTPLLPVYHWIQQHYRLTSRELKRLSSITLSPIYTHFNETLQGLATIRAFRAAHRFKRDNEEHLEANQKSQFASLAANQWLRLRLQFIGVAMVTGVGVISVIQHQFDVVDPGLVGLAVSYALSVTGLLDGLIYAFTETEREMIAVERVNQYIQEIKPESTKEPTVKPPFAWPSQGVIIFDNVVLRYREHLTLKGVNFQTRPAEKIGVVGRTGAGKSSLFAALFRIVNLYSGSIYIDTVDIAKIPLSSLRTRLSIIPQEPFLFTGTIRENLDPLNQFRLQEIWSALQRCNLTGPVKRLGGLQAQLGSGGQNLSVGQRQLLCLTRAVLHKAKILCIDEATANVDPETDRQIQQTIRSTFTMSTVITIAHRVQTIMDSDRVIVIDDGQILEFDSPITLMQNPSSKFYQLATQEQVL